MMMSLLLCSLPVPPMAHCYLQWADFSCGRWLANDRVPAEQMQCNRLGLETSRAEPGRAEPSRAE